MDYRRILFGCTITFSIVLEFYVRYFNMWKLFGGSMDSVMHFFWGVNIFLILILFLKWKPRDAILGVFVWQMTWESIEMIGDHIITQTPDMIDHMFFDGMKDTLMDLFGGLLAWGLVLLMRTDDLRNSKLRPWMSIFGISTLPMFVIGSLVKLAGNTSPDVFATIWILVAAAATGIYAWKKR